MAEIRFARLRGRIVEKYGSQSKFAEAVGLSKNITNKKLQGKVGFSRDDMERWAELLDVEVDDIGRFFFEK